MQPNSGIFGDWIAKARVLEFRGWPFSSSVRSSLLPGRNEEASHAMPSFNRLKAVANAFLHYEAIIHRSHFIARYSKCIKKPEQKFIYKSRHFNLEQLIRSCEITLNGCCETSVKKGLGSTKVQAKMKLWAWLKVYSRPRQAKAWWFGSQAKINLRPCTGHALKVHFRL